MPREIVECQEKIPRPLWRWDREGVALVVERDVVEHHLRLLSPHLREKSGKRASKLIACKPDLSVKTLLEEPAPEPFRGEGIQQNDPVGEDRFERLSEKWHCRLPSCIDTEDSPYY